MKVIILTTLVGILSLNLYAQRDSSNIYSMLEGMESSNNPGEFYLDKLRYLSIYRSEQEEEGNELNEVRRNYELWKDRIPTGIGINPMQVYGNALQNAASATSPCAASGFVGNWKQIGPIAGPKPSDGTWLNNKQQQGRVYCMYANATSPNTIYAGSPWGGLWKTTDGGKERHKADEINNRFEKGLQKLQPKLKTLKAFKEEFGEVFKANEDVRKNNSSKIEMEINKYEERIAHAQKLLIDGIIETSEYRSMKDNFETEISKLKRDGMAFIKFDNEIEEYVNYATDTLKSLEALYLTADLDGKSHLVGWMFPEKLQFPKNKVPTLKPNKLLSIMYSIEEGCSRNEKGLFDIEIEKSNRVTA